MGFLGRKRRDRKVYGKFFLIDLFIKGQVGQAAEGRVVG